MPYLAKGALPDTLKHMVLREHRRLSTFPRPPPPSAPAAVGGWAAIQTIFKFFASGELSSGMCARSPRQMNFCERYYVQPPPVAVFSVA